jgi:hypothetical protein
MVTVRICVARDISTLRGETFYDIKITRVDNCGIGVAHRSGVVFLDFSLLNSDIRREFGYSEQAYAACKAEEIRRYQAAMEYQQQLATEAATQKPAANVPNVSSSSSSISTADYSSIGYSGRRYDRDYSTIRYGEVHVRGYFRKDGTYVRPHTRSYPHSRK